MTRSFLFVPADSERKLKKSHETAADAVILDLEDSVAARERPRARSLARAFLDDRGSSVVWIRINPLTTEDSLADLRELVPAAPHGIVLPKSLTARDVVQLGKILDVLEQENGIREGQTRILPIVTEVPAALFHLHEYAGCSDRLEGLSWGAEDLSSALGATTARDASGRWLAPYEMARSLCLIAAASAEVMAVDTIYADYRDSSGLSAYAANARRDGFSAMLAIHPDQVTIINEAFTPTEQELARARRIVELFDGSPDTGVIGMDGEMLDRPHLVQARKIIRMAGDPQDQARSQERSDNQSE